MTEEAPKLDVLLSGKPIGAITALGGDRSVFSFDPAYIEDRNRATLGLGFVDNTGELLTDFRAYQTRLMPFFSNLLPEGYWRQYLTSQLGLSPANEYALLCALGDDLPGAIVVCPSTERGLTHSAQAKPAPRHESDEQTDQMRFSLAGVQLKFSAIRGPKGGLTIPAHGIGGSWVVKLPSLQFDAVPENEFSMLTLAKRVGINVPDIELVPIDQIANLPSNLTASLSRGGRHALVIERFDRLPDGSRVHMEDFAQIFGVYPDDKYRKAKLRSMVTVLVAECDAADVKEFVKRMVFSVLIGNGDMHLKNWSLLYPDQRTPILAPAYDFVSTVPYLDGETMALNVSRTKRFDQIDDTELRHFATKSGLSDAWVINIARQTVRDFWDAWQQEQSNLPLSNTVRQGLNNHLNTLPLANLR